MKKQCDLLGFLAVLILLLSSTHVFAGVVRVKICHWSPGNHNQWHTIIIPEKSLQAHLAHGDLAGSCDENIDTLCDDGNPCTVDVDYDTNTCLEVKLSVDCNDENPCTIDNCDETTGCVSEPVVCDDGDLCTISQCASDTGECVDVPKVCTDNEECSADTGTCEFIFGTVESAGQIWMDRNLGASRVAQSPTDAEARGDYYQWGRLADGHEKRNSPTTTSLSDTDVPGHGSFIYAGAGPFDWRVPHNDNLWQGVSGTNNPCPSGFRLPTDTEFDIERVSWSSNDNAGAFASPLKMPMTPHRLGSMRTSTISDGSAYYWTSIPTTYPPYDIQNTAAAIHFNEYTPSGSIRYNIDRINGLSVRCILD